MESDNIEILIDEGEEQPPIVAPFCQIVVLFIIFLGIFITIVVLGMNWI